MNWFRLARLRSLADEPSLLEKKAPNNKPEAERKGPAVAPEPLPEPLPRPDDPATNLKPKPAPAISANPGTGTPIPGSATPGMPELPNPGQPIKEFIPDDNPSDDAPDEDEGKINNPLPDEDHPDTGTQRHSVNLSSVLQELGIRFHENCRCVIDQFPGGRYYWRAKPDACDDCKDYERRFNEHMAQLFPPE